jgi:hypothetical protein
MPDQKTYSKLSPKKIYFTAALLCLLLFILFNSNLRHGSSVDTIPNTALPLSILKEGNVNLNEYRTLLDNSKNTLEAGFIFGAIQIRGEDIISSYPIGASLLAIPFYFIADISGNLSSWHDYRVAAKISSSAMVALSASFLFLSLAQLTAYKPALIITLLYGAGTSMWSIVSQDLWQHGPGIMCLSAAIFCLLRLKNKPESRCLPLLISLALSFSVVCRLLNAIPAALIAFHMLVRHRNNLIYFILPAAVIAGSLLWFNISTYGSITGGYDAIYTSQWHGWRNLQSTGLYSTPIIYGLSSILFSPNKGLLIYSPYLIYAFTAIIWILWRQCTLFSLILIGWVLCILVLLAKNTLWWGGTAFGPRYLSEILLPLSLLLAVGWQAITKYQLSRVAFIALAALSISIQMVGAYRSPCGWADAPTWADHHPERHWDWSDSQIERCLRQGVVNGPENFELLKYTPEQEDF